MIRLFVNTYVDPIPRRNAELVECLERNRNNSLIGQIHELSGRPTVSEILAEMRAACAPDDVGIMTNADIYFDETAGFFEKIRPMQCFALTRWENGKIKKRIRANGDLEETPDSQDVWGFRGKPPEIKLPFTLGIAGVDNRFAKLLYDINYEVTNPCKTIRCHHLHASDIRRYGTAPQDRVVGPYFSVHACSLAV
jgi:hypothetical protein